MLIFRYMAIEQDPSSVSSHGMDRSLLPDHFGMTRALDVSLRQVMEEEGRITLQGGYVTIQAERVTIQEGSVTMHEGHMQRTQNKWIIFF